MDLILSVLADPSGTNMLKHTKLFTPAGGSLGRADSNDWVLPDPERVVSSRHALITFSDNQYYLVDESTNGTYHNQAENPVGKGNRVPLNDGDILGIGDYQLKVTLRKPKVDSGLPKGLGEADFLDSADRTTFSPAAAAKMQKQAKAQQLDSWLEPGASSAQSGEWGYVSSSSPLSNEGLADPGSEVVDPLAALGQTSGATGGEPLSGFGGTSGWEDDDWWKEGSEQDHAPADRHAMHFTTQQAPAPEVPPLTETPPAPFAQSAPPATNFAQPPQQVQPPPAPPQQPAVEADNPFAESFAVMQGQQVDGAPGFDSSPAGGFSAASQPFSQLQQPSAAEPPLQQVPAQNSVQTEQAPMQQVPPQAPAQPVPPPQQVPVQQEVAHTSGRSGASALAQALGLNLRPEQQPQLEQQAAEIVQETVTRLIDLLRARSSIKNELRVQRTVIQTEANNPLKFSATATDALSAMFAGNGAFMDPRTAVADSFDDLSDHQVAVLAGMRAGYEAMLKFFNPENIERRLNSSGSVFASKNAKNWEGFVQMYRELAGDPESCYRRLFGDEFASTYEHQLSELKNARNLKR
ncbi:type VI secretion system-associated FHA domain protein TagH [Microbulbifer thermotolerans]|uniref:type VI secretion system-associated FHA domain protein TagH n=1 Tax=Microbulbifer thermotolerans TaxID=252514 RepID=UPI0008F12A66|nr:type VI secretion system-associated FHA domain protein TagH [Microbulbifer thermotolerans]MCX2780330.1 type VI secretion system-associated FHA domain protein TagH [Microbulbifer thermotolerans]MCX2795548.1 type VI secretion system-associated FHA domain protein TagH [Microbulbifer thermotolerans]MCX2805347.1 type VI secretion system-associated FHA domain protein TagH [Microbulbifer thermotolerans]MCX2835718.1 type VI secretion system-associated FHA domain protein TagH [Microbulbifer thermotol